MFVTCLKRMLRLSKTMPGKCPNYASKDKLPNSLVVRQEEKLLVEVRPNV